MSVLVDTSVWSDNFRKHNPILAGLMVSDQVLTHPMVIGELACGTPPEPRLRTLSDVDLLATVNQATSREVRELIEREALFGLGCGLVDLTLLASALITPGAMLWTLDKRLSTIAGRFGVCYMPAMH